MELREFTEGALREGLRVAGFRQVRIHFENDPGAGIFHSEPYSLPISARKAELVLGPDSMREMMTEWTALRRLYETETRRLSGEAGQAKDQMATLLRTSWVRIGKKLRLCP